MILWSHPLYTFCYTLRLYYEGSSKISINFSREGNLAPYKLDPRHPKLRNLTPAQIAEKEAAGGLPVAKKGEVLYAKEVNPPYDPDTEPEKRKEDAYKLPSGYTHGDPDLAFNKGVPPRQRRRKQLRPKRAGQVPK